jgi:hypothetical protein
MQKQGYEKCNPNITIIKLIEEVSERRKIMSEVRRE